MARVSERFGFVTGLSRRIIYKGPRLIVSFCLKGDVETTFRRARQFRRLADEIREVAERATDLDCYCALLILAERYGRLSRRLLEISDYQPIVEPYEPLSLHLLEISDDQPTETRESADAKVGLAPAGTGVGLAG